MFDGPPQKITIRVPVDISPGTDVHMLKVACQMLVDDTHVLVERSVLKKMQEKAMIYDSLCD